MPASILKGALPKKSPEIYYSEIKGTVWTGVVKDVSASDIFLGDIRFRISPWSLLTLRLSALVELGDGAIIGRAKVTRSLSGQYRFQTDDLYFDLSNLRGRYLILGEPIQGSARLTDFDMMFTKAGCLDIKGNIWTDFLRGPATRYDGDAFDLSGPISCENRIIDMALDGNGDEGSASLKINIDSTLSYQLTAKAEAHRQEVRQVLQLLGFEATQSGLTYNAVGVFKGV